MINNNKDKNIKFNVKEDEEFKIRLVADGKAAPIIIDNKGKDYKGLKLVADSFAEDVNLVSGIKCDVVTDINNLKYMIIDTPVIIAGSIGNNEVIDLLIKNKVIDVSEIKGKRECYKIEVVDKPIENIKRAVVVIGSDKRGSIYGIYNISELMGVSPWVYFADVMPKKRDEIIFDKSELNKTSKEPSVKYRGFFLNDEWPSLGSWVTNTFGDFNELFYDKVFQLILRLKGNFMWPAMWSAVFSENGKSNPLANAELANDYGIVMGTSHHESMFRAGEEWKNICNTYGDNKAWDFRSNSDAISKFWEDGLKRNKNFESLITVGMRGEQDSALEGTQEENIELLKKIILTQKEMLKNQGLGNAPQVLTIYKEVEKYWYGTNDTNGLRNWDVLNDVTIMLADDNFANVRTLPAPREKDRKAGWGMYYHFDYHGGPISYEWVNTTPLEKIWEQMTMAYEYGVRDIWIVNVGDLKPMEFPLSYFMDLAYDFDKWGTNGLNKTDEYTKRWVKQQFGDFISDNKDEIINGIADVLEGYTKMSGFRKPEVTYTTTYSYSNYNEAQRVLDMADKLESEAQKYYESASDKYKDSFYQLVYYPAAATANVVKMQIYAGFNNLYYKRKSVLANIYYELVEECKAKDIKMQKYYNETMSDGKWKGMMSSPHIGYRQWEPDSWTYPETCKLHLSDESVMIVNVEGYSNCDNGDLVLPHFTNTKKETYTLIISNGGNNEFNYNIETSADWILVDEKAGIVRDGNRIRVSIDWDKVSKSLHGMITITGADKVVKVEVNAKIVNTNNLSPMTFVEAHNVVSIEAEHMSKSIAKNGNEWTVLKNYGRTLSSVKVLPVGVSFEKIEESPYLEYLLRVEEEADYILTVYTAPTNNLQNDARLRYAVAFDDEEPIINDTLSKEFIAGDYNSMHWCVSVLDNIHISKTNHKLTQGVHKLRFYVVDAGVVLQKLALSRGELPESYFGPEESYYIE